MQLNPDHGNDFIPCKTKAQIALIQELVPELATLNIFSGMDKPKYIRYKQMPLDFEIQTKIGTFNGEKGDYLFVDMIGGKTIVPYDVFKNIFTKE